MKYTYIFLIYLTLSAALGNGLHSASKRSDFEKKEDNVPGK
jgi:hypothetical protein